MNRKTRKRTTVLKDYVTVAFAEDMDLAREYSNLLAQNDIPSVLKNLGKFQQDGQSGVAVMVPEEFLDEAYVLISEEASYDDFFDAAFRDHGYGDQEQHDPSFYDEDEDEDNLF
jgi:hypothetical protein